MSSGGGGDPNGPAAPPEDEETRIARLEVENGFRQYDETIEAIGYYLDPERPFALRPGLIQRLQGIAVEGMVAHPGQWRTTAVKISKSQHQPPEAHLVPSLIQEMCDYARFIRTGMSWQWETDRDG